MADTHKLTRQWLFSFRQGTQNITRSPFMSLLVVSTMTIALSVLGFLLLTISDLNYLSLQMSTHLKIVVFLSDDQTPEAAATRIQEIKGVLAPVTQLSKADALKSMSEELPELKKLLENPDTHELSNPFPATLEVSLTDIDKMKTIGEEIRQLPGVEGVEYNQNLALQLRQIENAVQIVGFTIAALLFLGTLAIIINTIQLAVHNRQREIEIMHLVGAPDWFIRLPFLIEGLFFGVVGALSANVMLVFWRMVPLQQLQSWFSFIQLEPGLGPIGPVSGVVIAMGILMGILGSSLSVHRYIRFEKSSGDKEAEAA